VDGTCGTHGKGVYKVLVGRPEGKRPQGRPRRRWEDNIKMNIRELVIDNELSGSIKKAGCFLTI
jgi:hypothetical protein